MTRKSDVSLVVNTRRNTVLAFAPPDKMAVITQAVKMLDVKSATELAEIIVSVGLAQNLGAMRALATDGIQKGHMSLHARTLAATAGATPDLVEKIAAIMVQEKNIRLERAQEILKDMKKA